MEQAIMAKRVAANLGLSPSPLGNPKLVAAASSSSIRIGSGPKLGFLGGLKRGVGRRGLVRVSASAAAAAKKPSTVPEIVLQPIKEISGTIKLPGSKSLSNRILLIAALAEVAMICSELRRVFYSSGSDQDWAHLLQFGLGPRQPRSNLVFALYDQVYLLFRGTWQHPEQS